MRGIAVEPVDAAGRNDADRRLLAHHGADLHRARVRAQHQRRPVGARRLAHVERVMLLARRMLGRNVQFGEVEIVGLDVRPLGDRKTHVGEDFDHLVPDLGNGMDASIAEPALADRQRGVDEFGLQLFRQCPGRQRSLARLKRRRHGIAKRVDRLSVGSLLAGGQLAQLGHQLRHPALLAQRDNPHLLEPLEVRGARDLGQQLGFEFGEVGGHRRSPGTWQ